MGRFLERLIGRIAPETIERLPPRLAGLLDYLGPPPQDTRWGPLNGQRGRHQIIMDLLGALPFAAIVETGTYLGNTTDYFAQIPNLPILSVEAVPRWFHYARLRLRRFRNVTVSLGDSRQFLRTLAADRDFPKESVFFYLDAHWFEDVPLADEIGIIARGWAKAVIVIDDFEVPGDPGYGFDDYGPGKRLCLADLPPLAQLRLVPFFPTLHSSSETGLKRGCLVLVDEALVADVRRLATLRPAER